eukprot:2966-Rhodomonas_salina.1
MTWASLPADGRTSFNPLLIHYSSTSHATNQLELDNIDIDCIILSSHGLDPSLPWKEYGLFGDESEEC